jgi:TolB protein
MGRRRIAAVALAVTMMGTLAGPARAQAPVPLAQLAYSSGGRIFSIAADGSGRQQLSGPALPTVGDSGDLFPRWSPDGSAIAFTRVTDLPGDNQAAQLFVMAADGSGPHALTPRSSREGDATPAWSPDGRSLAFAHFEQSARRIVSTLEVMSAAGGPARSVARVTFGARQLESLEEPAWSPDGSRILYTVTRLGHGGNFHPSLFVVAATGGKPKLLAREAEAGAWSPDGLRIAFASVRDHHGQTCGEDECDYNGEIYTMDANGRNPHRLTRNTGDDNGPDWSPDGTRIVFSSDRNFPGGESPELYSIASDGSCLTWLTDGAPGSGTPDWRPGGGSPAAGGCGALGRSPLVETDITRASRFTASPLYWLGRSFGGMLLSDVPVDHSGVGFLYYDCGSFNPHGCGTTLQVDNSPVCSHVSLLGAAVDQVERFRRARGALVLEFPEDGGLEVVTGPTEIHILADSGSVTDKRPLRSAVAALVPLSGQGGPGPLPPPAIPRALKRKLDATRRAFHSLGSVDAVHRRLHVSRSMVRGRLRLAHALRPFGKLQTLPC